MDDLLARDVLDYDDRLKMAALRILAESRKPVDVRGPGEIRIPVGTPPDNWLYNTLADPKLNAGLAQLGHNLVGSGTGSISGDILAGILGGGAGIATEAAGGESGALDWLPGGGLLKGVAKAGGVVAAPWASRILKNVARTQSDDAIEIATGIAERSVERLRGLDHIPTKEEINDAVMADADLFAGTRGADNIRVIASDIVGNTIDQAARDIEAGRAPTFRLKIPETIGVNHQAIDTDELGFDERRKISSQKKLEADKAFYRSLPEEQKQQIRDNANRMASEALHEAHAAGVTDVEQLRQIRQRAYISGFDDMRQAMFTASKEAGSPLEHKALGHATYGSVEQYDNIHERARGAGNAARDEALRAGRSEQEAMALYNVAYEREKRAALKELDPIANAARLQSKKDEKANIRKVYSMFTDDLHDEIYRAGEAARAEAKQKFMAAGLDEKTAIRKANDVAGTARQKLIRSKVKELGFKSVNDPRLANYERIGRNDTEHILKSGAGLSMAATPETAYGRAVEEEAQELARKSGEDYSFVYDILMGRNNGDEDAMALYDMLMGK